MNSQITLPILALSKTNKSVTLKIAIQLNLLDDVPIIEAVAADLLHHPSEPQLTLALPIQLIDPTSLKEDDKIVTKPNEQVEESSLAPVEEALTEMVAREEPKVDEPEPIYPSSVVAEILDIPADSLISSSSSLVLEQPNDSSSTEHDRLKIDEVQPILAQEESPPSSAPSIEQNILDEPKTTPDVQQSLEIMEPIASKPDEETSALLLNDSSSLKPEEQEATASNPVVQVTEALQTSPVEEAPVENSFVDEPKVASPPSSLLNTSPPATLYQPETQLSSGSLAPSPASSVLRSSRSASSTGRSSRKCTCGRSAKESRNSSLSSDDNSKVLSFTFHIDLEDRTIKIGPKPDRKSKQLPLCSPKKPRDRSRSRDEEKKERRSSRHCN